MASLVVGRVDGGTWTDAPTEARLDQKAELAAIVVADRGIVMAPDGVDKVVLGGRTIRKLQRLEAKTIAEKYLAPPATTDFGLLYLPFEGLYAEVLRRPGLFEALQRDYRVTVCGPTTLSALLNSLQMGFRTLAIEKRSSEVWQVLGAVKSEFGRFGEVLARTKAQLQSVANSIDAAETRTRQIERKLKDVEALPGAETSPLIDREL